MQQHGLAAVGDEREKGEGDQGEEQVLAVEVSGEDRDNADYHDQVVDHSQGSSRKTHRRRGVKVTRRREQTPRTQYRLR